VKFVHREANADFLGNSAPRRGHSRTRKLIVHNTYQVLTALQQSGTVLENVLTGSAKGTKE
jgi:hypothetical protein